MPFIPIAACATIVTLRLLLLLLLRISLNGLIVSSSNTLIGSIALTQLCIRFACTSISLSLIMCLTTPTPLTTWITDLISFYLL
ncbi:hypothetical protein ERO13_D08G083901v2 [Gossypium hirsutum]|nr:hypothetical protein ERO13_D08G083901v2 [Gossypium hirsutum]